MSKGERPLEGVRVIEMGQLLAGPFTGTIWRALFPSMTAVELYGSHPVPQ